MANRVQLERVTIANGGTTSTELTLNGRTLAGLYFPAAFTGTTMTFEVADSDDAWRTVADGAGADVSKTVAADKYISLSPATWAGVNKVRLVSGGAEGAERLIYVAVRVID